MATYLKMWLRIRQLDNFLIEQSSFVIWTFFFHDNLVTEMYDNDSINNTQKI